MRLLTLIFQSIRGVGGWGTPTCSDTTTSNVPLPRCSQQPLGHRDQDLMAKSTRLREGPGRDSKAQVRSATSANLGKQRHARRVRTAGREEMPPIWDASWARGTRTPDSRLQHGADGKAGELSIAEAPRTPQHTQGPLTSLLHVRVCEVCEREAGDVGRRDGEPGAGRWGRPAGLRAAGGRGRGEVLGLQGGLRGQKAARGLGHERVRGEVVVPFKASTCQHSTAR